MPILAYSKNVTDIAPSENFSIVSLAIRFPGEPITEMLPPIVAPAVSGIRSRLGLMRCAAATPMTIGISTATVPVFETKLDTVPENSITVKMSVRSPGQNRNNAAPIFSAMPVLNSAAPITLIATTRMMLCPTSGAKISFASITPQKYSATGTENTRSPIGKTSTTKRTTATKNMRRVIPADVIGRYLLYHYSPASQRVPGGGTTFQRSFPPSCHHSAFMTPCGVGTSPEALSIRSAASGLNAKTLKPGSSGVMPRT